MATLNSKYLFYLTSIFEESLTNNTPAFFFDPLILLIEHCIEGNNFKTLSLLDLKTFNDSKIEKAKEAFSRRGILGLFSLQFRNGIINNSIDIKFERKVIALKKGFPSLPATKASIIMNGFDCCNSTSDDILSIYASYGLAIRIKKYAETYDFNDINRRVSKLSWLISQSKDFNEVNLFQKRYWAMRAYLTSDKGKKEEAIKSSGLTRSLFFFYWKSFNKYGLLGLVDKGKQFFRESKMGLSNEARIVIDKLQHPDRKISYYVNQLRTKGIKVDRSALSKIFNKWDISNYKSEFINNLKRL